MSLQEVIATTRTFHVPALRNALRYASSIVLRIAASLTRVSICGHLEIQPRSLRSQPQTLPQESQSPANIEGPDTLSAPSDIVDVLQKPQDNIEPPSNIIDLSQDPDSNSGADGDSDIIEVFKLHSSSGETSSSDDHISGSDYEPDGVSMR